MRLRSVLIFICLLGAGAQNLALAQAVALPINLIVGEVVTLPTNGKVIRVGVGNGKLFRVTLLEKEQAMVLVPEAAGKSNLILWDDKGHWTQHQVNVLPVDMELTTKRINDMLTGIGNVRAERAGDLILIVGSTTKNNMSRIDAVAKLYPAVVHNVVRDEELMMKRMVYFRVQIVEMKKSLSENLGIKWDNSINGPAAGIAVNFNDQANFRIPNTPPTGFPNAIPAAGYGWRPFLGLTSSITSMVNLAINNGDAYVLASPELSARSGGKAEFLAGGQIPIVSPASGTQPASVSFKDYGIKLSIEPVADEKNNISTSLKTEVSSVDSSVAVSGNPGFLTRKTDSEFNLQSGQTIVLSGLVNKELSKDISKMPALGDLPVLGNLFRSSNFKSGRTDMVILVTPYVIESDLSKGINQEMVDKAREIEKKANSTAGAKGILQ